MNNHEDSRAAFEGMLKCENVQRLAPHMKLYQDPFTQWKWGGWKMALDWRDSQVCEWTLDAINEEHDTDCARSFRCIVRGWDCVPGFCPGCGRRVKISETNEPKP